jgi:hypothetical protein
VRWRVVNEDREPIELLTAVQPHAQFRAPETPLRRTLEPGSWTDVALSAHFAEPPGARVENPFLILRVRERGAEWRVLARVSATAGPGGRPVAGDAVTTTVDPIGAT